MLKLFRTLKKRDIQFALISVVLIIVQVWLDLTMPDYTAKLTEAVSSGRLIMKEIWKNGGMMFLCALGSMAAALLCSYFTANISANFSRSLRGRLFDRICSFSDAEINRFSTPSLITRTTNDVSQMEMLISIGMSVLLKAPILAVWAICKVSSASVLWTWATVITVVIIIVSLGTAILVCYPKFKLMQKLTDDLNRITRENLSGIRVIRAFNAEGYQQEKFGKVNKEVESINLFTARTMAAVSPLISMSMSGLTLAIYWIGAVLINAAEVSERAALIGSMTAFTQYVTQIVMAFMMISIIFLIIPRAAVSAKRINEVLDTEPSITYGEAKHSGEKRGELEFRDVAFGYADDAARCIEHISFKVESGETFAVIGATGAGKTTLIKLIPRFYDASEGEVLIDGKNVKDYSKEELESMVSVATQKPILFKGDVKYNVIYGSQGDVSDDDPRIQEALSVAHADFVLEDEAGIHREVAQSGMNLSGGQKQRLSIARAVFRKAEILILDDTFSALDYRTDMLVRRDIKEKLAGTTVIIVAQRIGTIRNADKILVLDGGRAVGLGTHEELMQACPVYREIALSQLSKEEL